MEVPITGIDDGLFSATSTKRRWVFLETGRLLMLLVLGVISVPWGTVDVRRAILHQGKKIAGIPGLSTAASLRTANQ